MIKRTLFFGNPARLSIKNSQLCIELQEQATPKSVDLQDVGLILLEHNQITLSHAVLQACMAHNIVLVNCDDKHMPQGIMIPLEGHVEMSERNRNQLESSLPFRKNLWVQTVVAKISNQAALLVKRGNPHPKMRHLITEIKAGDASNCEGQAAAIYWNSLFGSFPQFLRDRYGEPPNHYLNYGYAILRAMVARALISSGLILSLGIHHRNKYNAFCLADDIMEPYRPFVDAIVCSMVDKDLISDELTMAHKKLLLTMASIDVLIDDKISPLWNAIIRTAQSLEACYRGSARKLLFPSYGQH